MDRDAKPVNACLGAATFLTDAEGLNSGDILGMKILLVGNYAPDAQESMTRYAQLMHAGLTAAGHEVVLALPTAVLNRPHRGANGVWKWVG